MMDIVWLIDLDNTLHNASHAVFPALHANMNRYIAQLLGDETNPAEEALANAVRIMYWKKYGATLPGLMRDHHVNPNDFLHQTHQFENLTELLRYEAGLRRFLHCLPGRKVLLTNAPRHYAQQVIKHLGVHRRFDHHISIESMYVHGQLRPKPSQWLLKK